MIRASAGKRVRGRPGCLLTQLPRGTAAAETVKGSSGQDDLEGAEGGRGGGEGCRGCLGAASDTQSAQSSFCALSSSSISIQKHVLSLAHPHSCLPFPPSIQHGKRNPCTQCNTNFPWTSTILNKRGKVKQGLMETTKPCGKLHSGPDTAAAPKGAVDQSCRSV
eukprot:360510-Chlamydomonas_euryale.AAC.1